MNDKPQSYDKDALRDKIAHILSIYPILSPSMLQIGLGPNVPPRVWKPILRGMIDQGVVLKEEAIVETPLGQHRPYTKLQLA